MDAFTTTSDGSNKFNLYSKITSSAKGMPSRKTYKTNQNQIQLIITMHAVISLSMYLYKFFNTFARFMSFLEKKKSLGYRKKTRKLHRSTLLRVVNLSRFLKIHLKLCLKTRSSWTLWNTVLIKARGRTWTKPSRSSFQKNRHVDSNRDWIELAYRV